MISELKKQFKNLDPSEIQAPRYDKTLEEEEKEQGFADSIKENGVQTPIIVRYDESKYQLVTGKRRHYYAKKYGLEIPCIIWKNPKKVDIALVQLSEMLHRRDYTDTEKANGIAAVYQCIDLKPEHALRILSHLVYQDKKIIDNNLKQTHIKDINPTQQFLEYCKKIGRTPAYQVKMLELITELEPEVLEYSEKRELPQHHKTLLVNKQLNRVIDEKTQVPEEKIEFKKYVVDRLQGKGQSEARDILHETIEDVRLGVHDMKTKAVRHYLREQSEDYNASKVTEGRMGASHAFMGIMEGLQKAMQLLTANNIAVKGIAIDDLPKVTTNKIETVINTHTVEMIKNLDERQFRSMLNLIEFTSKFANRLVPLMLSEEESRITKKKMMQP